MGLNKKKNFGAAIFADALAYIKNYLLPVITSITFR